MYCNESAYTFLILPSHWYGSYGYCIPNTFHTYKSVQGLLQQSCQQLKCLDALLPQMQIVRRVRAQVLTIIL